MATYISLRDMFDGGGPGRSGPTFEGGGFISDFANQFMRPAGYAQRQQAQQNQQKAVQNQSRSQPSTRPVVNDFAAPKESVRPNVRSQQADSSNQTKSVKFSPQLFLDSLPDSEFIQNSYNQLKNKYQNEQKNFKLFIDGLGPDIVNSTDEDILFSAYRRWKQNYQ